MSADVALRPAVPADRDDIVALFLACWTETYAGVMPPRLVGLMDQRNAEMLWDRALQPVTSGQAVVAESPPRTILGVTRWRLADDDPTTGLIDSLYVAPSAQGSGVGGRLLAHAVDALAGAGATTARLWAFRDNAPAIAFYRRHGWSPDGGNRIEPAYGEPEIRLAREISPR